MDFVNVSFFLDYISYIRDISPSSTAVQHSSSSESGGVPPGKRRVSAVVLGRCSGAGRAASTNVTWRFFRVKSGQKVIHIAIFYGWNIVRYGEIYVKYTVHMFSLEIYVYVYIYIRSY